MLMTMMIMMITTTVLDNLQFQFVPVLYLFTQLPRLGQVGPATRNGNQDTHTHSMYGYSCLHVSHVVG